MRLRPTPLPLIALVITLVATLGGCGGSTTAVDDLPADAVFLTAVDRSTDISTVRVEYETTSTRNGEVLYASWGEGVLAPGAISFTSTSTMGQFAGEGEVSEDPSIEMRFVDGVAYIRMPQLMLDMPEEDLRTWIVLDDDDDALGTTAQFEQLDFGATLQALRDSAEVTEDGRETIAGVATTRYVGTTTMRSLQLAEGRTEEQLEQLEQFNGDAYLDEEMPLTVWIDDEGLIRRFDYTTGHDGLEITQSMTVLEYGLEVDIAAPPAEETMSMEEFEAFQQGHAESFGSEFEFEGSEGIVLESEGSATGTVTTERSATSESVPAPTSTIDSDG